MRLLVLPLALGIAVSAVASPSPPDVRAFLEDGPGWLLSEEAREALRIADPGTQKRLIHEFLAEAEGAVGRAVEARGARWKDEFLTPLDARAHLLFVRGEPLSRLVTHCPEILRDVEVWEYDASPGTVAGAAVGATRRERYLFYRPEGSAVLDLWAAAQGETQIYSREAARWLEDWRAAGRPARRLDRMVCKQAVGVIETLELPGVGEGGVKVRLERVAAPADAAERAAWSRRVLAEPAPAARVADLGTLAAAIEAVPLGQKGLLRIDLTVPDRSLLRSVERPSEGAVDATPQKIYALALETSIERGGRVLEIVRARFELPVDVAAVSGPLALSIEPKVRSGAGYVLRFRVRDEAGGGQARLVRVVDVPFGEAVAVTNGSTEVVGAPPVQLETTSLLGADSVSLVPPDRDVLLGVWRAEAIVTGTKIRRVVFAVDGSPQLTRSGPPWSAELRLPAVPREIVIRAEGLDAANQVVASDLLVLNQVRGSLEVKLVEPRSLPAGVLPGADFRARAEIVVPDGRRVVRVEFRLGDRLVTTRTEPPWTAKLAAPADPNAFVTATAVLDDGSQAEDVRFLRSPENQERVDVDLVEIYASVTDRDGRPVTDLPQTAFELLEDGRKQKIERFARVTDLPLTLGVVIDTSGSMLDSLGEARAAAGDFLRALIGPGDRAFAVSFAGRPQLVVPRTPDGEAVARALEKLEAEGSTALHDALVHSLYYFRGTRGQRALVVLSDGDDTSSLIEFDTAIDIAKRSGVSIYTIGLKLSFTDVGAKRKLETLARETGGQAFFAGSAAELTRVYARIEEELRSQFLLAYVSDARSGSGSGTTFRAVEVKLRQLPGAQGLKARTTRGYYR